MKRLALTFCALIPAAIGMTAQNFAFTIDPSKTYTDGYARILLYTHGTFRGSYNPLNNVLGTQTKAGMGVFGTNENDLIQSSPFFELGRAALLRTSGTFNLNVDTAGLRATLTSYIANRVPQNNLNLTATVALNNEMFQTLKPTFSYSDHLAPQRLGSVTIDEFKVTQHEGPRSASIVPLGSNKYAVSITFMSEIEVEVKEFGQTIPMKFDSPYSLVGILTVSGTSASFGYGKARGGENFSRNVSIPLQPFPFLIPNGAGLPANLIMSTTINRIGLQINGLRQMSATTGL